MFIVKIVIMAITVVLSVFFLLNLFKSSSYSDMFAQLDSKKHQLKDIYPVGLNLIEKFGFNYKTKNAKKLRQQLEILYGKKYTEYYLRVVYGQSISTAWLVAIIGLAVSCVMTGITCIIVAAISVVLAIVVFSTYMNSAKNELKNKGKTYLAQFPNVVSTIALLVNSGMILRDAWEQVAYSDNKDINVQMQLVCDDMKNGMGEKEAYYAFATRCSCAEIRKFVSFLLQGMEKGSADLAHVLVNQSEELWNVKRENALKSGELASTKLLIPIIIIFVGILIMVMGPIMTNLST